MSAGVLILGGGQAGFETAAALRAGGYERPVRILGEEPHPPYQRPPLSKALLLGKADAQNLPFRSPAFYAAQGIELLSGEVAVAIDRAARSVTTANGRTLAYDALVLATGARARPLPVPGADLEGVLSLRTVDEAREIGRRLATAGHVVVIGGGFIGLEVAAAARILGKPVTVLEAADRLMGRAVTPPVSEHFAQLHRERGVDLRLRTVAARLIGEAGALRAVELADGARLETDLAVIGIGVVPNAEIAAAAGIACDDGIRVDRHARTSDPLVLAAGDCASHPSRFALSGQVRLESVQNATDQARAAAATILGRDEPYDAVPWFWSDQYDVKLQMAGLARAEDRAVLRGDPASGRFSIFYFRQDRLVAVDSMSRPGDHLAARRLLATGTDLSPAQAADPGFDLRTAAARRG